MIRPNSVRPNVFLTAFLLLASHGIDAVVAQSKPISPDHLRFFESKIRPVLVEHCYSCHSADSRELGGGLQVDGRDGLLKGGDSGPAIVSGRPDASLLIKAIKQTDRDLIMPPKESGKKLPDSVIADFELWVRSGAPDPRSDLPKAKKKYDPSAAQDWWAWKPRKQIVPPQMEGSAWIKDPIDRYILAALKREGMQPAAQANRTVLVRRLAFDLTGLPPSVTELYDFALSPSPEPIEKLVDRYLNSPAYGERMGRRWLDVARYAESAGKDFNGTFPHAWRYRDYVIDAFASDMSFRNFIAEQIAGDLLPSKSSNEKEKARRSIATGFLAIGPKGLNEMNARQFAADVADEQIDAVSQAFLAVTIACARCHDHKFDPITQRDYTAMAGIFLSTQTHFGTEGGVGGRNRSTLVELPSSFAVHSAASHSAASEMDASEYARKNERLAELRKQRQVLIDERQRERRAGGGADAPGPEALRLQQQIVVLETELAQFHADGTPKAMAMAVTDKPEMSERGMLAMRAQQRFQQRTQRPGPLGPGPLGLMFQQIGDSPLLERGEIDKPGERVPRGLPVFFAKNATPILPSTSGRLELARWIASDANPLTARVIVNRVWSWLIGRGLVESVDNFGSTGELPSHPELLDALANDFVKNGWSIKKLVRRIVLSRTYGMSSDFNESYFTHDPENKYLWRANPRILDAEAMRDAVLSSAAILDLERPHGSLISRAGDGVIGGRRQGGLSEEEITKVSGTYRSVYLPIPRNLLPDILELFDFPDNSLVHGTRETTLVPGQSLFWMNSQAVDKASESIAQRVFPGVELFPTVRGRSRGEVRQDDARANAIDVAAKFNDVCLITLSRPAYPEEILAVENFVADQKKQGVSDGKTWTSICRSILSSADFRRLR